MLKVTFTHDEKKYHIYCSSFEYSANTGITIFYCGENFVRWINEPITILWVYISGLNANEYMGYSNYNGLS